MHFSKKVGLIGLLMIIAVVFTACPSQTTISKINADPGEFQNKDAGIVGKVTDSYGVLGQGAYEVDDGTGRIWVVTKRGVPSRGARVGVKGRVYTGFSWGGRGFGTVIEESDRRVK